MDEVLKNVLITAGIVGGSFTGFIYGIMIGQAEMKKKLMVKDSYKKARKEIKR